MNRQNRRRNTTILATSAALILAARPGFAARSPAAISDEEWKRIAESQLEQTYTISRGDTLYDISKRLFGDPNYWPKIWAINGDNIPNPHLIYPSRVLKFSPGTTTSLPSLEVRDSLTAQAPAGEAETATDAPTQRVRPKGPRSQEWRQLPQQPWEEVQITLPEDVDAQGFDLKTRYVFPRTRGLEAPWLAASDTLDAVGKIVAARDENRFLSINDWVYIEDLSQRLSVGQVLAITSEPSVLKASTFSRKGYAYPILGKVKILGQKDGLWVAQLVSASGIIERDRSFLMENPGRISVLPPIPATEPIEATFLVERGGEVRFAAQHKMAFIDRGSNDGVAPGMIFRSYQHRDPYDDRKITSADAVIAGDVQVLQVSERFSLVLVVRSLQLTIEHGTPLQALTDVSDLTRQKLNLATDVDSGVPETAPEEPKAEEPAPEPKPTEDLDSLESDQELTEEEKQNLDQLETHTPVPEETQKSEEQPPEPTVEPSPTPTPTEAAVEPSPEEQLEEPAPELAEPEPEPSPGPTEEELESGESSESAPF